MGLFDNWPYTNFHELNLSWLLKEMLELNKKVDDFVNLNTIKYADPIQWNITKQYETNTVVIDGNTGTAYISTKPVPGGVALTNTDYWTVIFTLDILSANQNITFRNDAANVLATFGSAVGDWLLWNAELYKVTRAINVNEAYVVGYNLERITVELFIREYITNIENIIGNLSDLTTSDTDSIVDAINSMITERGALSDLTTSDNDSIVDAINSIITERGDLSDLDTTDKTSIVNAINEVSDAVGDLNPQQVVFPEWFGAAGDGITDDTSALQNAINNSQIVVLNDSYKITNSLTLRNGTILSGKGSIIVAGAFDAVILSSNNIIDGLTFTDTNNTYTEDDSVIYASEKTNLQVTNCKFNSIHLGYCVRFDKSEHITVTNNKFNEYSYAGVMLVNGCRFADISYNEVLNGRSSYANRYPISVSGYFTIADRPAQYIKCNYNHISDDTACWEGIDSHSVENAEFIGNKINGVRSGIVLSSPTSVPLATGYSVRNVLVKNNYISVTPVDGVANGIICSIGSNGRGNVQFVEIANNYITNTATPTITTNITSAIGIRTGMSDINIHDNEIYADMHGISLVDTPCVNTHVHHNYIRGNTLSGTYALNLSELNGVYDSVYITENRLTGNNVDICGSTTNTRGLIKYNNNFDDGNYLNDDLITTPRSTAPTGVTKTKGQPNDFIRNTASGTVAGWLCVAAGSWVAINSTAI